MKFVVTGGAGFIGSNLVRHLVENGHKVVVIDNFHTGRPSTLKDLDVRIIQGNSSEIAKLNEAVDGVFHLGIYSSSPMYRNDRNLVAKAINDFIVLMEYAKKYRVKVVFASTSSIYNGNPIPWREDMPIIPTDFYTEARYAMERLAEVYYKLYGVRCIALRLFSVYGEREEYKGKYANLVSQFLWAALKGEAPVIYGDGSQTRDFIYVGDVVEAFVKAMEADIDFDIFNVGTGKNYSLNELVSLLSKILGKEVKPKYVENPIKNYVMHTLADTSKAEQKLGFRAKVSLEEGIRKILPYYEKILAKISFSTF